MKSSPLTSWVDVSEDSDFSIYNIPFGVFKTDTVPARCCTAIGDYVVDLVVLAEHGYFNPIPVSPLLFRRDSLNYFVSMGKDYTSLVRDRLIELFSINHHDLQDNIDLHPFVLYKRDSVTMMLPMKVGNYTDFYSSKEHATNLGAMLRDPNNALLPNWKHLPVAYHGRASSIAVSGTPVKRPQGQFKKNKDDTTPTFGPTQALDYELELAFVIGKDSNLGETVSVDNAEDYIFGFLLFNDWSARDIQSWEYVPLGPFLSKNFMSSVSPWIVTMEALAPYRTQGPVQDVQVLPYLQSKGNHNYDIELEVELKPEGGSAERISRTNFKHMYWNICQQLAHHTVNGCNVNIGDIMASGTISGPTPDSVGCLLERTRNGQEPIALKNGSTRKFLEDGDTVIMKGFAVKEGKRVGFGSVEGKVIP
ncbi:fumarylacetoacetase [Chryseolinea sp. H1M3-3]|uniref:fumarylacetoacetase n=1 Tax=Chryseolinea sp. H1M3-3 TaxID=3034144 RepID=UPI0023EC1485|nr:fumarylacetoacetase [Chryseolinea sp. H1M3-3]